MLLLVLIGGGLGAGVRYLVGLWLAARLGTTFPWGTLTVNLVGSFLIGLIATLADERGSLGSASRVFLIVGVLGGFTTFSSFSLETFRLAEDGDLLRAAANVLGSLVLAGVAVVLGVAAGRAV